MVKLLVIPASLRSGSHNARLAAVIVDEVARNPDVEVTRISLADFPLPIYDGDLEAEHGVPENAVNLARMLKAHDGVIIVTPEYNSSLPPLLKNTIDWISRVELPDEARGSAFLDRPFAISAASPGRLGGSRCLSGLRLILNVCQATVIPRQLALASASHAYDEMDRLRSEGDIAALKAMVRQLIQFAQQLK